MADYKSIDHYLEKHLDGSLQELVRLCSQPSVSAQNWGLVECVDLNLPIASSGISYPDAHTHAPNENIRMDLYLKGAKHIARIIEAFGSSYVGTNIVLSAN